MRRSTLISIFLCGGLLLAGTLSSTAQNPATLSDPVVQQLENQVDRFFQLFSEGSPDDAFEDLLADSPNLRGAKSIVELKERAAQIEQRFGRAHGHERISSHRVGQDVVLLKYLYKCETFPVVWYFTYYRTTPANGAIAAAPSWTLITVRFDTQIELLDVAH